MKYLRFLSKTLVTSPSFLCTGGELSRFMPCYWSQTRRCSEGWYFKLTYLFRFVWKITIDRGPSGVENFSAIKIIVLFLRLRFSNPSRNRVFSNRAALFLNRITCTLREIEGFCVHIACVWFLELCVSRQICLYVCVLFIIDRVCGFVDLMSSCQKDQIPVACFTFLLWCSKTEILPRVWAYERRSRNWHDRWLARLSCSENEFI